MSFMDQIGGLLSAYASGSGATSRTEAHEHYDQISSSVPSNVLASVIGPALSSLATSEVQQRLFNSASQMTPDQRIYDIIRTAYDSDGRAVEANLMRLPTHQCRRARRRAGYSRSSWPDPWGSLRT